MSAEVAPAGWYQDPYVVAAAGSTWFHRQPLEDSVVGGTCDGFAPTATTQPSETWATHELLRPPRSILQPTQQLSAT